MTKAIIKCILLVCGLIAFGAAAYPSMDGHGHELSEYVGVFRAQAVAGPIDIYQITARPGPVGVYLSIVLHDGALYSAVRSGDGRACSAIEQRTDGVYARQQYPLGKFQRLAATSWILKVSPTPTGLDLRLCSRERQCNGPPAFWARVADTPNVWDMFEFDTRGEPRYCVPTGLLVPGIST